MHVYFSNILNGRCSVLSNRGRVLHHTNLSQEKTGSSKVLSSRCGGLLFLLEANSSCSSQTILGALLLLPEPAHKSVYYVALITELCKLSPSTVGPAVGKSIRKLYGFLADGLDVELACRFGDWFAIHMSNFNFQWVWKEWYVISGRIQLLYVKLTERL